MKVGDMIEANTGHTGIIVDVDYIYPRHQEHSPLRSVEVLWNNEQPHHSFSMHINKNISSINAFAIKKVISHGED